MRAKPRLWRGFFLEAKELMQVKKFAFQGNQLLGFTLQRCEYACV